MSWLSSVQNYVLVFKIVHPQPPEFVHALSSQNTLLICSITSDKKKRVHTAFANRENVSPGEG